MRGLDRGTVDLALVVLRQLSDEHDVLRFLVTGNLSGREFDDLVGGGDRAGALRAHGLDPVSYTHLTLPTILLV